MSLRQRLVVIVCLAVVALLTAGAAVRQLVRESDTARMTAAWASTDAAVDALGRRYRDEAPGVSLSADDSASHERLRALARSVTEPLVEGGGGFCTRQGLLLAEVGPAPRFDGARRDASGLPPTAPPRDSGGRERPHHRPPFGPPPEVRDVLRQACLTAAAGRVDHRTIDHPTDALAVSVVGITDDLSGFTLMRVAKSPSGRGGWPVELLAMALVTALMVIVTLDAMFALKRGATELERTVQRLESDLLADVPAPRAAELARIAEGLRRMAAHLADARERERALERRVSHDARLSALGRLVAGVAHEIRNPLTGLKLKLDVISRRHVDAKTDADLATCLREAARIDAVVSSVLGVARDRHREPRPVELSSLVAERTAASREFAEARGVTLATSGTAGVSADPDLCARVLDNLLRNAIEASPRDAVVAVTVAAVAAGADVCVIDRGAGIPAARVAELFEPFFTLKPDGTGLGLWMSRALVEATGGRVEYARRDALTVFTLHLPSVPTAPASPPENADADAADRR